MTDHSTSHTGGTTTRLGETVTRAAQATQVDNAVFAVRTANQALLRAVRQGLTWLRETVTMSGWLLLVVLVVGLAAGWGFGIAEGWVAAIVAGALLVLSVPFLLGGATLDVAFRLDRDRVVAGDEVEAEIAVRNASRRVSFPSVLDIPVGAGIVEAYVPLLLGRAEHADTIGIAAPRRGVIQVGPMMITRGDPLGILRRNHSWSQLEEVHVHPRTVRLPSTSAGFVKDIEGQPSGQIVDSDLAFHAIREYMPGDSRRHVHWKSTAKTGTLMVRQFEESRRARIAVLLDVHSDNYADEEEFELGVSCAASLALQAVRDGRELLMVTSGSSGSLVRGRQVSIATLPTRSPKALLDATCLIEMSSGAQRLEEVSTLTAQTFPDLSMAFVVSGSLVTMERLRHAAFAFPVNATSAVVRVEPGAEPTLRTTRDFSVLTIGVLNDLKHLIARGALG